MPPVPPTRTFSAQAGPQAEHTTTFIGQQLTDMCTTHHVSWTSQLL